MRKRRYIRAYTGIILTIGLITFTLTDGFTVSRENLILFDPKGLFFVVLFTLIYSFMTDQGRASARNQSVWVCSTGALGCLIGVTLTLDLRTRSGPRMKYASMLWYGVIGKIFADAFSSARARKADAFVLTRSVGLYMMLRVEGSMFDEKNVQPTFNNSP